MEWAAGNGARIFCLTVAPPRINVTMFLIERYSMKVGAVNLPSRAYRKGSEAAARSPPWALLSGRRSSFSVRAVSARRPCCKPNQQVTTPVTYRQGVLRLMGITAALDWPSAVYCVERGWQKRRSSLSAAARSQRLAGNNLFIAISTVPNPSSRTWGDRCVQL
jgi:hypothetical protein